MGGTLFIDYHFFLLSFESCEFKEYNTNLKGILSDLMHAIATLNKRKVGTVCLGSINSVTINLGHLPSY